MIHQIYSITETQVSLDRCTGQSILKLRAISQTMENSYLRLEAARVITLPLLLNPVTAAEAIEVFKTAARVEQKIEEMAKQFWEIEEKSWNTEVAFRCKISWMTKKNQFPSFPYDVVDPGTAILNLKETRFLISKDQAPFFLKLEYGQLKSTAKLERKKISEWNVAWVQK